MLKFLADVNVESTLVDFLRKKDFDVLWIPDYDCQLKDDELLNLANKEKRVLITNDTDFGELVYLQKRITSGIVLFRIKGQDIKKKLRFLNQLIRLYSDKIENHFIVIADKRIRIRILEVENE
jgi:predicted nuclease of predicted toxin-antitoxin system